MATVTDYRSKTLWDDYTHVKGFTGQSFRLMFEDQGFKTLEIGLYGGIPGFGKLKLKKEYLFYRQTVVLEGSCPGGFMLAKNEALLVFSYDFPPEKGGIQTCSYEIAKNLNRMGVGVMVLTPRRTGCS